MRRIRIIADNKIPFLKGSLESVADIEYWPGKEINSELVKDADAIITRTRTKCNEHLLSGSNVKFIASATIGFDHIDTEYCNRSGITWANAPGCNSSSVQQYIVSALLFLGRNKGMDLSKLTIGVIGIGNVGKKVCMAAEILGMSVIRNDPPRARTEGPEEFSELSELLKYADIVTLHVPLNRSGVDRTFHMVDKTFIEQMKQGAVLINTSRGEVAEEAAIRDGIQNGKLSAVILDVFENEPVIDKSFADLLTIATPHIAGYSSDGKANGTMMSVRAISRFFKLGLDNWKPENVPLPGERELYLDATDKNLQEMVREVYSRTYDIIADDSALRNNIEDFETLREKYPVRREPTEYAVRIFNGDSEIFKKLEGLGFSVIGDSCF